MMRDDYLKQKDDARNQAKLIEQYLEIYAANDAELSGIHDYLQKLAKRTGLVREFKRDHYL